MFPHLIVIGAAPGELPALQALLAELSEEFPAPVVVVQHPGKEAPAARLTAAADHVLPPIALFPSSLCPAVVR